MFKSSYIGYILLIVHIISSILVGIIFRFWKKNQGKEYIYSKSQNQQLKQVSIKNSGLILGDAIRKSIGTILNIGGFVVVFSVIISILNSGGFFYLIHNICTIISISPEIAISVISGLVELTNGINNISTLQITNLNLCFASFMIGFGGISVLLQVYSIIEKEKISIKPYFFGKLLQGILAFLLTAIIV